MLLAGFRLFVSDVSLGNIYSFEPQAYVEDNKPLKGYVLDLANVPDWSGYRIDLEGLCRSAQIFVGLYVLHTNMVFCQSILPVNNT